MAKIHTLVMHVFPDIETLFMSYLLTCVDLVRKRADIAENVTFKFIPSGALRREDWEGVDELEINALEDKGYLFLDCGGGKFDQHGKPVNALQNTVSSLDIMVHALELDSALPKLMPLVEIISKNDLTGQDVARDKGMRQSKSPHTPRHLRNIVQGWNMLYGNQPMSVMHLVFTAFTGMVDSIDAGAKSVSALFLLDELVKGVETSIALVNPSDQAKEGAACFREEAELALSEMERDWSKAVNDYWNSTRIEDVAFHSADHGVSIHRMIALAAGNSQSHRYGAVTRLGNTGPRHKQPHQGKRHRPKADVTIQFRGVGKFIISTRGIELEKVARAIRKADLEKRGLRLETADIERLGSTGSPVFEAHDGSQVSSLYLAEYRTCFGNTFRTNPHAQPCALNREEIVSLTIKALGESGD